MLELRRITKRYSGIPAVEDASFIARPGEVTGYLGPNGFGKFTTSRSSPACSSRVPGRFYFAGSPSSATSPPTSTASATFPRSRTFKATSRPSSTSAL